MLKSLAHAGEDHSQKDTVHAVVHPELLIFVGLAAVLALFWLLARHFKLALTLRLFIVLFVLLATGIAGYTLAPIVSTIALATGFAIALAVVFLPFIIRR